MLRQTRSIGSLAVMMRRIGLAGIASARRRFSASSSASRWARPTMPRSSAISTGFSQKS